VPDSPRIAPASTARSGAGTDRVEERVDVLLGAALIAPQQERPPGVPPGRVSESTAMAGRGLLPAGDARESHAGPLGTLVGELFARADVRIAEEERAFREGCASEVDRIFQSLPTVLPATSRREEDVSEIVPRFPASRAGAVRDLQQPEFDAQALLRPAKRTRLDPHAAAHSIGVVTTPVAGLDDDTTSGGQPAAIAGSSTAAARLQAPEAAKVLELAERVMLKGPRGECNTLGRILTSVKFPGIPESMHQPLPHLVCQEWIRAFGPEAQDVGPLCPTIGDVKTKSLLQGLYVSTRLLDEGKLCQLPPGLVGRKSLPAPTDKLRAWTPNIDAARNALSLICAAKANGLTDADAIAFAKEKVSAPTFAFMRRLAHLGESNLAMVHALYGLDSASVERRRSTPRLGTNQTYRTTFIALTEIFEEKYGEPGPSGIAARAELREWLPPSLKKLLPESDTPARLEMATLLMEAAVDEPETLENVCSYVIAATDASSAQLTALMAVAEQRPELVKLRDRLRGPPAP
jgi:hypothetical protein